MISVFGSYIGSHEIDEVNDCLASQWLGLGKKVETFENKMKEHLNTEYFVMVDNCSNALYLAIKLLELPPNSKIVVPSYTWVACANAVILAGHEPIFADVDLDTMNITSETIKECIDTQGEAAAIMVVHYAGLAVEIDDIKRDFPNIPIIEDAAHAINTKYNGKSCGTLGTIGCFSFDSIKNISTCDAGGMVFENKTHYELSKIYRYCGIGKSGFESAVDGGKESRWWEYNIKDVFIRMIPNNVSASIGIGQINRIEALQYRREELWNQYRYNLDDLSWITLPKNGNGGYSHSYFTYCIRTKKRDKLAKFLMDRNIYTTLRYHPLHMNPIYKKTDLKLKNCSILNETALNLPLHPRMSDNDLDSVVCAIEDFGDSNGY